MPTEIEIKCRIVEEWRYLNGLERAVLVKEGIEQHNYYYSHPQLNNISVRTRSSCPESDRNAILVQKFGSNPVNGTERVEIELETGLTQRDLGVELDGQGFFIESQWYRQRASYDAGDFLIEPALNSGFGRIVELEATSNMNVDQLIDEASEMGLAVIPTELMDKAYKIVAGDSSFYNSFLNGRPKYIDWDELC